MEIKCGTINASYKGVADPKLEATFHQSAAEEAKYKPIMEKLQKDGLSTKGTTISGI